ELTAYAIASQGYSEGLFNARTDIAPEEVYVKPEEVDNYEFGFKGKFMDGRLSLNAALFYMDLENTHLQGKTDSGFFLIWRNGGPAESKGFEVNAEALLGENWTLSAGYTYARPELAEGCSYAESTDPANDCAIPDAYTAEGDELPGWPENQGHVRLTYSTVMDNGMDLHVDYGFTAQSEILTTIGDSKSDACCREDGEELPGYSVHYASVGLADDSWEASLFIDNLYDKYAETGVRLNDTWLYTVDPFVLRRYFKNVLRPRTVGVDFRYKFR
ncbi:MAG: TonB-dependent receptor, partial [Gammaproteobacteria bacterium]|nr:TonB-dependent receptor [Gammaproteobacteria bacterium]